MGPDHPDTQRAKERETPPENDKNDPPVPQTRATDVKKKLRERIREIQEDTAEKVNRKLDAVAAASSEKPIHKEVFVEKIFKMPVQAILGSPDPAENRSPRGGAIRRDGQENSNRSPARAGANGARAA